MGNDLLTPNPKISLSSEQTIALTSPLLRDGRTLILLFVSFRLMLLMVYQPLANYTPGLTAFGDYSYFHDLAQLADKGELPYRDYWYEYPPVIALVSQGVYTLVQPRGGDFTSYALLLGIVLTAFDAGNLILLRRIGTKVHGPATGTALAWIYALFAVPLVVTFWTFDSIAAFFTLLTINWLLSDGQNNQIKSAVADALGALTKLVPLLVLGAVWRFRPAREAIRYTAIAVVITILGLGAILLIGGQYGLPSLTVQFTKSSAETVWALLDGNYKTGILSSDHHDPASASQLQGNPPAIPGWLRTGMFAAIGLFVFAQTRRRDARGMVAFIGITFGLFYLWSPNWSPQWQVMLIPLILLNYPNRNGVLLCLALGFVSFIEYPLLFAHTPNGEIAAGSVPIFIALILTRTVLLTGFSVGLYRKLRVAV